VYAQFKIKFEMNELINKELLNSIMTFIENAKEKSIRSVDYSAFKKKKVVVYYAANKNHIGFYPTPSPIIEFQKELLSYKTSKGAIQFPLNEPFPKELIQRIIKFRAEQVY
jgi:uncharacterized protein YdhG (YjbR/CyaY superfamily)